MNERGEVPGPNAPRLTEEVGTWLHRARGPALVVAPAEAALLAANDAGLHLLGLEHSASGVIPLDSAMPAIMDLRRALQKGDDARREPVALVFWTANGIARLPCHVALQPGTDGRPLALIEIAVVAPQPGAAQVAPTAPDCLEDLAEGRRAQLTAPATETVPEGAEEGPSSFGSLAGTTVERDEMVGGEAALPLPDEENVRRAAVPHAAKDAGDDRNADTVNAAVPLPQTTPTAEAAKPLAPQSAPATRVNVARPYGHSNPAVRETLAPPSTPHPLSSSVHSPAAPASRTPATGAGGSGSPGATARGDAETLKAIARQILAGRRKQPAAPQTTPASASPSQHALCSNGTTQPLEHNPQSAFEKTSNKLARERASFQPAADAPRVSTSMPAAMASSTRDVLRSSSTQSDVSAVSADPTGAQTLSPQAAPLDASLDAAHAGEEAGSIRAAGPASAESDPRLGRAGRRTLLQRMAHELKTPISAIISAAEIMKDERLGPIGEARYLRYAQDIHESARHALAVIERLLGQRQPGRINELSFTNLDVNALAAGLLSSLEVTAKDAGQELSSEMAKRLPLVVADATSVRQILLNLLTNALKFTPRGGRVGLVTQLRADGHLTLSVVDSGPGMSEADIARALSTQAVPSQEETESQRRPGGGFGIGLALVRTLAAANGATLSISSGPAGGTEVTLAFPPSRLIPV